MQDLVDIRFLDKLLTQGEQIAVEFGPKLLAALVIFFLGKWLARLIARLAEGAMRRARVDAMLVGFAGNIVYVALFAFVVLAALNQLGVQTTSFIAVVGAAGLAVGLALQGSLSNFAAGVMLLVFRPFQKGDFIEAVGVSGSVDAVGIFTTTLNTPDNVRVILPNAKVWGDTIKNFAANDIRRIDLLVGIAYDDDIGLGMNTIRRVLAAESRVLKDPEPTVAVGELGDSSVNLVVRPWCKREEYWAVRWDLTRAFKEELERAGCSIPFPQRDVHVFREKESAA